MASPTKHFAPKEREFITMTTVAAVAKDYRVKPGEIFAANRERAVARARHVCFWVLINAFRFSLPDAAAALNREDHGSALHSRNVVEAILETEPEEAQRIGLLVDRIKTTVGHVSEATAAVIALSSASMDVLTAAIMRIKDPERLLQLHTLITGRLTMVSVA